MCIRDRLSEASLAEVDKGMIEAAFASGAGKLRTMFCIVLPEAHVPLVKDITITAISLLGFSAMAGLVGGGGLGDLAYRYGYQRYNLSLIHIYEFGRKKLPYLDTHDGVWVVSCIPTFYLTTGGLAIDTEGHVLSDSGEAVAGLYAAGRCV